MACARLRLAAAVAASLAVALPCAVAHAAPAAPQNLHAFGLRVDEPVVHTFSRTPSFAWNPVRGAKSYEFELSTSRTFTDANVLFQYTNVTIPALAVDHQLPWMTGVPYALWAHVRWVSADGKQVTPWSAPYGFNLRWRDTDYPQQQDAPPGKDALVLGAAKALEQALSLH